LAGTTAIADNERFTPVDSRAAGRGDRDMDNRERLRQATELWQEAYRYQMEGDLDRAIEVYQRSIDVYPTAEAHTFRGWAMNFQGRLEEALDEGLRAIEIDPDFGNPYNDIGVYLMQQGKLDEAIPRLEKAKQARRYEPRQFPFMNLGRIYLKQGRWWDALREFEGAVRAAPEDIKSHKVLHSLIIAGVCDHVVGQCDGAALSESGARSGTCQQECDSGFMSLL